MSLLMQSTVIINKSLLNFVISHREFEAWKLEHHRNIQEQYSKRKREDERLLQEKADEDIQIVKEKLRLELDAKKKELLCGKDSAIDVSIIKITHINFISTYKLILFIK